MEANGAPCISDLSIVGMMLSLPLSAVGQFLALSGEVWPLRAALAKPAMNAPPVLSLAEICAE